MKATLTFSNNMPSNIAMMPSTTVVTRDTLTSVALVDVAVPKHAGVEIVADRARARQRRPRDDREDRRERDRRDEALHQVAADRVCEMDRRHIAAAEQRVLDVGADVVGAEFVPTKMIAPNPMMKVRM